MSTSRSSKSKDSNNESNDNELPNYKNYSRLLSTYYNDIANEILVLLSDVDPSLRSIELLLPQCQSIKPIISEDVKQLILKELKKGYNHSQAISMYGNYYKQLLKFGIQLDACNDKILRNLDKNQSIKVHKSTSQDIIDGMERTSRKEYACVMRYSRLNCWTRKVLLANTDIITIDIDINKDFRSDETKYFECTNPFNQDYVLSGEEELFNLKLHLKMNSWYFYVFEFMSKPLGDFHCKATLNDFNTECQKLISLYEDCTRKNTALPLSKEFPPPRNTKSVAEILNHSVLTYVISLADSLKVIDGTLVHPMIILNALTLLRIAAYADIRIHKLLAENFDHIKTIMQSLITILANEKIHELFQASHYEKTWHFGFLLIDTLAMNIKEVSRRKLNSRSSKLMFKEAKETGSISKILLSIFSVLLKALKLRKKNYPVYFFASLLLYKLSLLLWIIPVDVIQSTYLCDESITIFSEIIKERVIFNRNENGHCKIQYSTDEVINNSNLIDINCEDEPKGLVLDVLVNLVKRGQEMHERTILGHWIVDAFISKSMLTSVFEDMRNGCSKELFQIYAQLLEVLSRDNLCRSFFFSNGKDLIRLLAISDDPKVVMDAFLLFNRLLWDVQWKQFFVEMEPRIETIVAKWVTSVAIAIDKDVQAKLEILSILKSMRYLRNPFTVKSQQIVKSAMSKEEEEVEQWTLYAIHPNFTDNESNSTPSVQLLLTRIVMFTQYINKLRFESDFLLRFRKISLVELSTIFYDWPGNVSYHVQQTLISHASTGELRPQEFTNADAFVERLCNNFIYELDIGVNKLEHFENSLRCTSITAALLQWLICEEEDKNSNWYMIVKKVTDKALGSSYKEIILSSNKWPNDRNISEAELKRIREKPVDSCKIKIMVPPEFSKFCGNPACKNHTFADPKVNLKICSRCQSCAYCSSECQRQHWVHHKKNCTQKE